MSMSDHAPQRGGHIEVTDNCSHPTDIARVKFMSESTADTAGMVSGLTMRNYTVEGRHAGTCAITFTYNTEPRTVTVKIRP